MPPLAVDLCAALCLISRVIVDRVCLDHGRCIIRDFLCALVSVATGPRIATDPRQAINDARAKQTGRPHYS
jgi:hypothetical protein